MRTKTELSARPPAYTVAHEGTEAVIVFYTDVAENNERDDGTTYTAVSWMMKRPWSDGLEQRISASLDSWLRLAQQESYEESVLEIRAARDKLLADTDAEMCVDRLEIPIPDTVTATTMITAVKGFFAAIKNVTSGDMAIYRQALRDITTQEGFPYDVHWPTKP